MSPSAFPGSAFSARVLIGILLVSISSVSSSLAVSHPLKLAPVGTDKVIVHLLEWGWKDIARECRDLGSWGYWGVQVSPPQEDLLGNDWWTRYQPMSYTLLSRSGNAGDFQNMVEECKKHGVHIVVDVVINHMANPTGSQGRAGTKVPSKCTYPGLYTCEDFHHFCGHASADACGTCCNCEERGCSYGGSDNIWHCNLGSLPDLDTSRETVRANLAAYLNQLVKLGVAGFRVDAAKHIDPTDLRNILARVNAPAYVNQEIRMDGDDCNCLDYVRDYKPTGKIWEFKSHAIFYDAIMKKNLPILQQLADGTRWGPCPFADSNDAISFVVNHDFLLHAEDRTHTLTMFDEGLYSVALVTLLGHPYGQPTLLSSINFNPSTKDVLAPVRTDQGNNGTLKPVWDTAGGERVGCGYWKEANPNKPYLCEHTWPEIRNMVAFRRIAKQAPTAPKFNYLNNNKLMSLSYVIAPKRSNAFLVVNVDNNGWSGWLDTSGIAAGEYCNVAGQGVSDGCYPCTESCKSRFVVQDSGWVKISLGPMQTAAFHAESRLNSHQ